VSELFSWAEGFRIIGPDLDLTGEALRGAVAARTRNVVRPVVEGDPVRPLVPLVLEADAGGILTLLAAWSAGVVPAPLNPRLTEPERKDARARLRGAPPATLAVLWTSGTSGRPRGVALGVAGFEAHVRAVSERLELDGSEVWLASLSLAHVGGLALVGRAARTGATLLAPGAADTATVARALRGERPDGGAAPPATHLSLVPTQLERLITLWGSAPPPVALRCILVGGAHAPADLVHRATEGGWPVALTYGMTEMWSQVATAPPDVTRFRPGTVGRALPATELRIDVVGEILVRGPTRALGYLATEIAPPSGTALHAQPDFTEDAWYRTGDLGRVDDDGFLFVTGRRSDRIVTGGVNVDPAEVEDVLRSHPAVADAGVVGVPNTEWGETVAAVLVPSPGGEALDLAAVEAFVRERLSGPKRPRVWKVTQALPRNANGKLDRRRLADSLGD